MVYLYQVKEREEMDVGYTLTVKNQVDLADFKGWNGAEDTLEEVKRQGKMTELYEYVTSLYGTEMEKMKLNNILSFDVDLLNSLGLDYKDEEDDNHE